MSGTIDPSVFPETVGGIIGWISTGVLGLFTIITQMRKGKVDESAMVLGEWKKLFEAHKERVESLAERVSHLETENATLRGRVKTLEDELSTAKKDNMDLIEENHGLKRQVAQLAGSAVIVLDQKQPGSNSFDEKTKESRKKLDDID